MLDDVRLVRAITEVADIEREVRQQLNVERESASEQARGQLALRHVIALKKALESWSDTRVYIARNSEYAQQMSEKAD